MAGRRKLGKRDGSLLHDAIYYDSRVGKLTFSAFRLFTELNQQFNGFNNGNLSATPKTLRFDWCIKTLKKAKRELLKAGLIEITKPGVKRRPTLYALCHLPINEIEKHGIRKRECCSFRGTGKREYFYPVRVDLQERVSKALEAANQKRITNSGVKNTHP